ncbi:MAG: NADH-quinone oxidoreductase subunit M [Propionibacteriaceae bacterium]|jgi:NADH-quinone oxidoreductase subunit M|nr:NADH-quinone oxidoreductase subunit M [Propionibacteriaceae bacterium]
MTFPLLTFLGLLPLIGAAVLVLPVKEAGRAIGFTFALGTLAVVAAVVPLYLAGVELAVSIPWIPAFGATWALNLDGMGLAMVAMTATLVPVVMVAEWHIPERQGRWTGQAFFGLILFLEGLALLVFMAGDLLLFYLLFEATLIPMYFLIGGFGTGNRSKAAIKFLLFGLAGGLIMLVPVIGSGVIAAQELGAPTLALDALTGVLSGGNWGKALFICFLVAFILKAPMVPVHTWLPTAAESGTPGSTALMVGILDKLGTFGMIKICLMLFPNESRWAAPVMIALALVSIIYGALAAIGSKNLLRLVAYTSISHFGFMVLGIFTFTSVGIGGTMFYMLNHGFSTGALLLVLGFLISRRGSALVDDYGGVQKVAPVLSGALLLAGLTGLALPGMATFVSEFEVLAGAWSAFDIPWPAAIAALGTVLAAVYILLMYQRTMTGSVTEKVEQTVTADLTLRERIIGFGLSILLLVLGIFPQLILNFITPTAEGVTEVMSTHTGVWTIDDELQGDQIVTIYDDGTVVATPAKDQEAK